MTAVITLPFRIAWHALTFPWRIHWLAGAIWWLVLTGLAFWSTYPVIFHDHATDRHGYEASQVRCAQMDESSPKLTFQAAGTIYDCAQLPDGRMGLTARSATPDRWGLFHEFTSFIKGQGTLGELVQYMARIGADFLGALLFQWAIELDKGG